MRIRLISTSPAAVVAVSALVVVFALALGAPAADAGRRFSGYVACGQSDPGFRAPARHSCIIGNLPHAVFIDRARAGTRYRKCITVPGGRRYCAWHRTGRAGAISQRPIHSEAIGTHRVDWYVGGHLVRRWHFYMGPGD